MCPKPTFFVLFRILEILSALVTRETVLARVFDLHFLPEQYQLGVFSVRVIVFNVTNVLVMINPAVRSYEFIWTIHFSILSLKFSRLTPLTQQSSLHEQSLLNIYSFWRLSWPVHLIEFLTAFQFSIVRFHLPVSACVDSFFVSGFLV